jgi:hypothetical protein
MSAIKVGRPVKVQHRDNFSAAMASSAVGRGNARPDPVH